MHTRQIPEILKMFKVGERIKIRWNLTANTVSWRDLCCYPSSGVIIQITPRGIVYKANKIIAFIGIYDIASGTKIAKVDAT